MKKKSLFRWSVVASFFASVVMAVAVQAADMRTVAVVSVADLDTAVKTLKAVTTEAGYPDAMAQADMMLPMLQGFDAKQPIGIVIQADDESFGGYAFLPIADISAMPMLAMLVGMGEKQADGSILVPTGHPLLQSVYLKQSGKWAFISPAELPKNLPTDPAKLLEGMNDRYLLGVKVNVANLPKDLCLGMINTFRMMAQMGAQTEENLEAVNSAFDQIEMIIEQVKMVSFGIAANADNDVIIESTTEAVAGTVMAADMQAMANFKTGQIGFFQPEDNIAAVLGTGVLNAIVKQQYTGQLSAFFEGAREGLEDGELGPDEIEAAQGMLANIESMLLSTIESGKIDVGFTWQSNGTVLVGATIQDGDKLKKAFEQSLETVPEEFQQYVTLNDGVLEGYSVSTIEVPMAVLPLPEEEPFPQLKDKTITARIGVKNTAIALAVGWQGDVRADFAKAITASKSPAAVPKQMFVVTPYYLGELFKTVVPQDDPKVAEGLDALAACGQDGRITAETTFSGNAQNDKIVINHQLLPGIGMFVGESINAAQKARQQMMDRGYYDDEEDFEIDEFDF